jgi:hypothetical protein
MDTGLWQPRHSILERSQRDHPDFYPRALGKVSAGRALKVGPELFETTEMRFLLSHDLPEDISRVGVYVPDHLGVEHVVLIPLLGQGVCNGLFRPSNLVGRLELEDGQLVFCYCQISPTLREIRQAFLLRAAGEGTKAGGTGRLTDEAGLQMFSGSGYTGQESLLRIALLF